MGKIEKMKSGHGWKSEDHDSEKMKREDFDSDEELHFYFWIMEAMEAGYISKWEYHTEIFTLSEPTTYRMQKILKTKTKIIKRHELHGHGYEPDFILWPTRKFLTLDHGFKISEFEWPDYEKIYIDVKGKFSKRNSDKEVFSINQKWVRQRYGVLVHKLVPGKFFKRTWVPEATAWCKGRKLPIRIKGYAGCKLFSEIGEVWECPECGPVDDERWCCTCGFDSWEAT